MSGTAKQLILTVGFPRAGKTTWALAQGYPIVNPDGIRLATYGQRYWDQGEPLVWALAKIFVRALFEAGHPTVILDATNATRSRRRQWLDPAWTCWYHLIDTPSATCLERASQLDDQYIIPIIESMAAKFEGLSTEEWEFIV